MLIPTILGFANKFLDLIIIAQGDEEGAFALTPMINYLLATAGFFCMLMYAVTQGAFHDINAPSHSMFENELETRPTVCQLLTLPDRFSEHIPPLVEMNMPTSERANAELEGRNHTYAGHVIPWFVRLMWLIFWAFAIAYVVKSCCLLCRPNC